MRRVIGFLVVALLTVGATTALAGPESAGPALPHLRVEKQRIVDDAGRTVLLRGVNVNQLGDYFQANPGGRAVLPF